MDKKFLGAAAGEPDIEVVREPVRDAAVQLRSRPRRPDLLPKNVAQLSDAARLSRAERRRSYYRFRGADNERHILGAGPEAELLPAARYYRLERALARDSERPRAPFRSKFAAGVEDTDAFRAVEFVRGNSDEVRAGRLRIARQILERLHRVGMEERECAHAARGPHQVRDLPNRLDRADLVIRMHHGNQNRPGTERGLERPHVEHALSRDGHGAHRDAVPLEIAAGFEHRFVLDRGNDKFRRALRKKLAEPLHDAPQHHVVRLRRRAGEDDLAKIGTERRGDPLAGRVERRDRFLPERMHRAGVPEPGAEIRPHRACDRVVDRRRCRVIQIDPPFVLGQSALHV